MTWVESCDGMSIRILNSARRHWRVWLVIVVGSIAAELTIISIPALQKMYAVEMMMWAIRADDKELEGSDLLNSAVKQVQKFQAQDPAAKRVVPLVALIDGRVRLRAQYCLIKLNTAPPEVTSALIAAYHNREADPLARAQVAGLLTWLAPKIAEECGAAAFEKKYVALIRKPLGEEDRTRRLLELLP